MFQIRHSRLSLVSPRRKLCLLIDHNTCLYLLEAFLSRSAFCLSAADQISKCMCTFIPHNLQNPASDLASPDDVGVAVEALQSSGFLDRISHIILTHLTPERMKSIRAVLEKRRAHADTAYLEIHLSNPALQLLRSSLGTFLHERTRATATATVMSRLTAFVTKELVKTSHLGSMLPAILRLQV